MWGVSCEACIQCGVCRVQLDTEISQYKTTAHYYCVPSSLHREVLPPFPPWVRSCTHTEQKSD